MREVNPNGSRVVPGGWCSLRVRVLLCYHQLSLFLIVVAVFIIATTGRRTKKNYYYLFFLIKKKTNNNNNNNKWLQSNSRAISDRFTAVPKWFRINSRAILLNSFRFFGCRGERGGAGGTSAVSVRFRSDFGAVRAVTSDERRCSWFF